MSDRDEPQQTPSTPESIRVERELADALSDRYALQRKLGEGGMATVYLADDLKHERKVALKVLKPELGAVIGAERFLAEIKTTANLQHPHILPLYDSGEANGLLYYVMPYVEGESLRDRLDRERQLSVDDAVGIATNVAEALDYAHRQGVVHRDIKPANVLLVDGKPVISDFGIALAVGRAGGGRLTETGLSLGTPRYMSPEQATGDQEIGPRSDVYSLGCVLYEMLAGEPPFTGSSAQAVLAKILAGDPRPVMEYRSMVPPHVNAVVMTAIQRLAADRFASASDFRVALNNRDYALASSVAAPPSAGAPGRPRLATLLAVGALIFLVGFASRGWLASEPSGSSLRYELSLQGPPTSVTTVSSNLDVSSDGEWMVREWFDDPDSVSVLRIKRRDQLDFASIPGTEARHSGRLRTALNPKFSPDGSLVAFVSLDGSLQVIPRTGGSVVTLADSVMNAEWLSDEALVFSHRGHRLYRIPAVGGQPQLLFQAGPDARLINNVAPSPLPGERGVIFTLYQSDESDTWVLDLRSGEAHFLHEAEHAQYFAKTGHVLLGTKEGQLLAAPFNTRRMQLEGDVVPVLEGLATVSLAQPNFSVSESGTLVVGLGLQEGSDRDRVDPLEFVWVARSGDVEPLGGSLQFVEEATLAGIALSPDGTRLAVSVKSRGDEGNYDIWVKEMPDGPASRLTRDPAHDVRPYFAPDGERIVFLRARDEGLRGAQLFRVRADGADTPERYLTDLESPLELSFSRDGEWLVAGVGGQDGGVDSETLVAYRLAGGTTEIPLLDGTFYDSEPRLSADGRWLAYTSTETGRQEVYVRPFPDVGSGKWQVSLNGGMTPVWSLAANELFYYEQYFGIGQRGPSISNMLIGATYQGEGVFSVTGREPLLGVSNQYEVRPPRLPREVEIRMRGTWYAVSPDGNRFLFARRVPPPQVSWEDAARLVVIEDWDQELLRLLDERR